MNVEARLREIIGDAAGRLHTARSRNDQVATDLKLWVRDALDSLDRDIQALQRALIDQAEKHSGSVMPELYPSANSSTRDDGSPFDGLC